MASQVILLVEDDPNDVFFLKKALRKAGVRQALEVASDGDQAIAYLEGAGPYADRRTFPVPCLVVLDLKLPKRNGLEVLQWLRSHDERKHTPVVMLTSSDEPHDRAAALRHGVESYEVKPVAFEHLVRLAETIRREAEEHCGPQSCC